MSKKLLITEEEKRDILNMYYPKKKSSYVFESFVTVDGRYLIFQDEIWDNKDQQNLGNIWESIDKFKTIFKNISIDNSEYMTIRENIISLPITESNNSLYELRDFIIKEDFFNDTWAGKEIKKTGEGLANFGKDSWNGLKKLGVTISQGDWGQILALLKKGVKFILRKLKDALYSTAGMIVDAILVASGIGKTVQWIPWALVTSLDVYQMITNDYPPEQQDDPIGIKLLDLGFDILGLVSAGVFAKSAKALFSPIRNLLGNPAKATEAIAKNPKMLSTIKQIISGISKVPEKLKGAQSFLMSKFPKGSEFIGKILGGLDNILNKLKEFLITITGGRTAVGRSVVRPALATGGVIYGIDKINSNKQQQQWSKLQNTLNVNNVTPDFEGLDI